MQAFTTDIVTKLLLQSLPGTVLAAAVILVVEGASAGNILGPVFDDTLAAAVTGSLFILSSVVLGLALDTVFHTLGRRWSRWLNRSLDGEIAYRSSLVRSIGLTPQEFEWVSAGEKNLAADIKSRLMRFTEVAQTTGYAMVMAAAPVAYYLRRDQEASTGTAFLAGFAVLLIGAVLVFSSVWSLLKYEQRRTGAGLDEIRTRGVPDTGDNRPFGSGLRFTAMSAAVAPLMAVMAVTGIVANIDPEIPGTSSKQGGVQLAITSDPGETGVPVIALEAKIADDKTPKPVNGGKVVRVTSALQGKTTPIPATDLTQELVSRTISDPARRPPFELDVLIGTDQGSNLVLRPNDDLFINVLLKFKKPASPLTAAFDALVDTPLNPKDRDSAEAELKSLLKLVKARAANAGAGSTGQAELTAVENALAALVATFQPITDSKDPVGKALQDARSSFSVGENEAKGLEEKVKELKEAVLHLQAGDNRKDLLEAIEQLDVETKRVKTGLESAVGSAAPEPTATVAAGAGAAATAAPATSASTDPQTGKWTFDISVPRFLGSIDTYLLARVTVKIEESPAADK